jgi:Domain of unknown function (DUF4247)
VRSLRSPRSRWATGLVTGLLAVGLLSGCGAFNDVRDVIADEYSRAADKDQGTAKAYSGDGQPSKVADDIAAKEKPLDTLSTGGREYLQYDEYLVRVEPDGSSSTILVDTYDDGYQRWNEDVGQEWGPQDAGDGGPGDDEGK